MKTKKRMGHIGALFCVVTFAGALIVYAQNDNYTPSTSHCSDEQCTCVQVNGQWQGSCKLATGSGIDCSDYGTQTCGSVPCTLGPYQTVACPG
jgi:hypothetical protein